MAKLSEGISIQQLIDGGAEFEVQLRDEDVDEGEVPEDIEEAMLKFSNMNCLGDDDTYVEGEPFEILAKSMIDLTSDGGIKKKILREGYSRTPPEYAIVRVDYNAYVEYEPQPFDSTYSRRKKHEFVVNNSEVIVGLDISVQSMKLTEKSQFLITPEYAYGSLGCLGRVPKNAMILFEIELCEIVDSGALLTYNKMSNEKKLEFQEIYKYCLALSVQAKEKFKRNIREALKDYNSAISKIEKVELKDFSEQEKQQDLLLRLYTNVLVCYTILEMPKKGCIAFNKIQDMIRGTGIKLQAKVYFSNAKCLRMLGEFNHAKKKLEMAHRIEPKNPDIANEFILLKQYEEKHKKKEHLMAKALVGNINSNTKLQ